MQQWEFCVVSGSGHYNMFSVAFYTEDGPKVSKITQDKDKGDRDNQDAMIRVVAQLGLKGWELTSVTVDGFHRSMYFKRQKSPSPSS